MSKDEVIKFVEGFKNEVLIPLAKRGKLNEKLARKAVEIYAAQLEDKKNPFLKIDKDGAYKEFHSFYPVRFTVADKEFLSLEHYIGYSMYSQSHPDAAEFIREAKTSQMAHRRIKNTEEQEKKKNFNWDDEKHEIIARGYNAVFKVEPKLLEKLKSTGSKQFSYETMTLEKESNDDSLKYLLIKVLTDIRKEEIKKSKSEN